MYGENNVQVNIHELSSKLVYSVLIKQLCQDSIAETHFNKKFGNNAKWHDVCENVYSSTIDSYLRAFQFKLIHNIFSCNSMLKWNIVNSPRCS